MLGINSLFGKTIDSTAAMQRNRMKCFTCIIDSRPFSAGCETNLSCKAGLLTRSGFDAFPVIHQWQRLSIPYVPFSSRNLQQRELLPTFTAFPFTRSEVIASFPNLCSAKIGNFGIIEKLFFIGLYRFILVTLFIPICSLVPPFVPISI